MIIKGRVMSEEVKNTENGAENAAPAEKKGCGTVLGVLLLIVIAATVVFVLIVRPKMEEKGIDLEDKAREVASDVEGAWKKTRDVAVDVTERSSRAIKKGIDEFSKNADDTADKMEDASEKVNDAAEKVSESGKKVSENGKNAAKSIRQTNDNAVDKVESWY